MSAKDRRYEALGQACEEIRVCPCHWEAMGAPLRLARFCMHLKPCDSALAEQDEHQRLGIDLGML